MKKEIKVVRDYWKSQHDAFCLDTDVLTLSVETLTAEEQATLEQYAKDEVMTDAVTFLMHKVFNRHNDICCGVTVINENNDVCLTVASSITELNIQLETLKDCNKHYIYHVQDITKEILPTLTLEAIADVTAAVLYYNANTVN